MVSLRYIMRLHTITSAQVAHISKGAEKSDYSGDEYGSLQQWPASPALYH